MIDCNKFEYYFGDIEGKKKKIDKTIYTFDIETTNYLILNSKIIPSCNYLNLTEEEKNNVEFRSNMYIWMFGINEKIYYGRTWQELKTFLNKLDYYNNAKKIVFIHNLSFEFQYLKSYFKFKNVFARKKHKVIKAELEEFNIEFRCSYFMTNCSLAKIPQVYMLDIEKKVGDLDYNFIRHSKTILTDKELNYCEYDCLVIYKYILRELEQYQRVDKIPITSTGHVRRELKEVVKNDYEYKRKISKSININPHIFNLLQDAFSGGYTHSNWFYTGFINKNITSFDFTSSYPYILTTSKFPSTEFLPCKIQKVSQMVSNFAYLLKVEFENISCKFYNNFISASKCIEVFNASYDNGRIIRADKILITLTDLDFNFILKSYNYTSYTILESYYSIYNYLPLQLINFILEKYKKKTEFKNVEGKELEYSLNKANFNSIYGMTVTNTIRDNVIFDNILDWQEIPLTNEEIKEKLLEEKKQSFLSFSTGVWVTAYARKNLLENVIKLDNYVIYCDTDSIKLKEGFDISIIKEYNNSVIEKIKKVSELLNIDINLFQPTDKEGKKHMLGLFEQDEFYKQFITQGAKKYAYIKEIPKEKIKNDMNIIKENNKTVDILGITLAGVPKIGAKALKKLDDFQDDFIFKYEDTGKQLLVYCENQEEIELTDYQGNKYKVNDKSGCCIIPTTYVLGKSLEYSELLSDNSSKRARYKE